MTTAEERWREHRARDAAEMLTMAAEVRTRCNPDDDEENGG